MKTQEIQTGVDYRMTLKDAIDEGSLQAKLAKSPGDGLLMIGAEGYSEKTAEIGHGFPIVIELHKGKFRVLIWADINEEEPTHVISLEDARESNRESTTTLPAVTDVEMKAKNYVDDLVANKDDGACPDMECSGGITDGICSHCEDEWAYKQIENE